MMKEKLLELYDDSLTLGYNMGLDNITQRMLPVLFPGKNVEELTEEELVTLIKAVVTGLTSQVC